MMTKTQNTEESAIKDITTVLHIVKRPADPIHLTCRQSQFNASNQTHSHDSFIGSFISRLQKRKNLI